MGKERGNGMSEESSTTVKKSSRLFWFAVAAVAVLVLIVRNFEATKNILLVLLGFGAVVLVHEFGHFVVAKLCGIKVEAFSIFMPPILLGLKKVDRGWRIRILPGLFRKESNEGKEDEAEDEGVFSFTFGKKMLSGETEYRIGLIPFGGFVKMLGQDDVGPVKESQDPRSFANRPALVRAAVLAAGVTFNVISAAIVYVIVFLVGIGLSAPIVGGVVPGSSADKAGIRPGDEVIEIAGENGRLDFSDVFAAAVLSGKNEEVPMTIRRMDGAIEEVKLTAEQQAGSRFREFGIKRPLDLTIAQVVPEDAHFLKETTGLAPGDRMKSVGGVDVNSYWQFEKVVEKTFEPNVMLLAERRGPSGQTQLVEGHIDLAFPAPGQTGKESEANLNNISGMVPRMRITWVSGTFKERLLKLLRLKDRKTRLKAGDIIVAVGDVQNPTYSEMRELTNEYEDKSLSITVLRGELNGAQQQLEIPVVPKRDEDVNRVMIGIAVELDVEQAIVAKTIVTPQQPEALTIPRGATITAVDGVEVSSFFDVARQLKKNVGQRVTIDWRIDEQKAGNTTIEVGENEHVATIRAVPKQIVPFRPLERLYKATGPIDAMLMGYKRTKIFIIQAYVTLQRLIGGLVSPKELMGPVGILTMSYKIVADQPLIYYVYFLGLISASLAVLNFLPMPPLDGGLVALLLIEKIKGSALSMRTQEIIAYVGWGLVLALLLYVTANDIARIIFG
jgi:regulator of sigma E protease